MLPDGFGLHTFLQKSKDVKYNYVILAWNHEEARFSTK